jgi:hypothetical protein
MMDLFRQCFSRLTVEFGDRRHAFIGRLVAIAVYHPTDPWHDGWLVDFVRDSDVDSRVEFASILSYELRNLSEEAAEMAWRRWISDYWSERLTGVPRPLDEAEKAEMVEWVLGLRRVLDEAILKVCSAPVTLTENYTFYYSLGTTDLATERAPAVGKLLRHLLRHQLPPSYECEQLDKLVRTLISAGASPDDLRGICDSMAVLGCRTASELGRLIETGPGQSTPS